jgi:hypothetical protein
MLEKGDIARVIKGHFRMDDLMTPNNYDPYAQEKRDSLEYEDYRDATRGGCGFPWEHDEDEDTPDTSRYELGFVAMLLVDEMFGWNDAPASEYRQFLSDCGFNEETIDKLVPEHCEGKETEYILSY